MQIPLREGLRRPRLATIGAVGPQHMSSRLYATPNPLLARLRLNALGPLEELVAGLNAFQPTHLSAYPSLAALLAIEAQDGRLHISPDTVTTTSELRTAGMEQQVMAAWPSARLFNFYGTTAGQFAVDCRYHGGMHLFEDLSIVEVVAAGGEAVPDGTSGHHLLVTNLINRVQPLIRYELTDAVTLTADPARRG